MSAFGNTGGWLPTHGHLFNFNNYLISLCCLSMFPVLGFYLFINWNLLSQFTMTANCKNSYFEHYSIYYEYSMGNFFERNKKRKIYNFETIQMKHQQSTHNLSQHVITKYLSSDIVVNHGRFWTPGDPSAVGSHTANGTSAVVRTEVSAATADRRSDGEDSTGGDDGNSSIYSKDNNHLVYSCNNKQTFFNISTAIVYCNVKRCMLFKFPAIYELEKNHVVLKV
ncbi:hypothetical protein AGLY_010694 [Aphis glycines]|uniref:Uncharacterized protein n=1 Tax=Aphis glycines TaxID=307491 RepID=A0A6G0TEP5_APHGL|nr:hypothetical protein AGLY_010694 [Aphis glycines]